MIEIKCENCGSKYAFTKNIPDTLNCGCGENLIETDSKLNATFFQNMTIDGKELTFK